MRMLLGQPGRENQRVTVPLALATHVNDGNVLQASVRQCARNRVVGQLCIFWR